MAFCGERRNGRTYACMGVYGLSCMCVCGFASAESHILHLHLRDMRDGAGRSCRGGSPCPPANRGRSRQERKNAGMPRWKRDMRNSNLTSRQSNRRGCWESIRRPAITATLAIPPHSERSEPRGAKEIRTPDLCSAIAALYQLSYSPEYVINRTIIPSCRTLKIR